MSGNKTIIQGLDPYNNLQSAPSGSNPYARSANSMPQGGTIVPGMSPNAGANGIPTPGAGAFGNQPHGNNNKPVVGFLYSVSRSMIGEYWPIYLGRNTIGKNGNQDIILSEGTVSGVHATIVTRVAHNQVIAAITDSQSTNGTQINGNAIGFTAEQCHNGDILTIGNNYQLLLILIDAQQLGLSVAPNFISVGAEDTGFNPMESGNTQPGGYTPNQPQPYNPYSGLYSPGGNGQGMPNGYNGYKGTVGLDGSTPNDHGGTIPL